MDVTIPFDDDIEEVEIPSKTYALDFNNKRIVGTCDGEQALRQAIHKIIITARGKFELLYSEEYGSDIENTMIGEEVTEEFLSTIIPELVREALLEDDRISDVSDFVILFINDNVIISFTVVSEYGVFEIEEVE